MCCISITYLIYFYQGNNSAVYKPCTRTTGPRRQMETISQFFARLRMMDVIEDEMATSAKQGLNQTALLMCSDGITEVDDNHKRRFLHLSCATPPTVNAAETFADAPRKTSKRSCAQCKYSSGRQRPIKSCAVLCRRCSGIWLPPRKSVTNLWRSFPCVAAAESCQ